MGTKYGCLDVVERGWIGVTIHGCYNFMIIGITLLELEVSGVVIDGGLASGFDEIDVTCGGWV